MKRRIKKVIISLLLAFVMIFNMVPMSFVDAQDEEIIKENVEEESEKDLDFKKDEKSLSKEESDEAIDEKYKESEEKTEESDLSKEEEKTSLSKETNDEEKDLEVSEESIPDKIEASENDNSLLDTPLGNDWTLGDFIYEDNKVIGFSESGLKKVET